MDPRSTRTHLRDLCFGHCSDEALQLRTAQLDEEKVRSQELEEEFLRRSRLRVHGEMFNGASQIVSRIRTNWNGTKNKLTFECTGRSASESAAVLASMCSPISTLCSFFGLALFCSATTCSEGGGGGGGVRPGAVRAAAARSPPSQS